MVVAEPRIAAWISAPSASASLRRRRITAAVGAIPMVLAIVAVIAFGPETHRKQLEAITLEELAPQGELDPV